jgi:hypothetical protein
MNIGASILIGQATEDLRREGIQTPPAPAAKALTSSDGVGELGRREAEAWAAFRKADLEAAAAAKKADEARKEWGRIHAELRAASSPTVASSATGGNGA